MSSTVVCTIVSANYLARARVLMDSLARVHPEWTRHVLLVDEPRGPVPDRCADFVLTQVEQLPLPSPRRLLFRYSQLEANTAVKPAFLRHLFDETGCDRVVYLDPDVLVLDRLQEVEDALGRGSLLCVTPHVREPIRDDKEPSEAVIRRAGRFNLGFIAVGRHRRLDDFLAWWWSHTEHDCRIDPDRGLFLDQRCMDDAPRRFDDVYEIEHPGYNVAYWNLGERPVTRVGPAQYQVRDRPLVFFHFSGYAPDRPDEVSRYQNRFTMDAIGDARKLFEAYRHAVFAAGEDDCRGFDYAFDRFTDGTPIPGELRSFYALDEEVRAAGGDDPFQLGAAYFNEAFDGDAEAQPRITRLLYALWATREELRKAFPDDPRRHRRDLCWWFVVRVGKELDLDERWVAPVRDSLCEPAGLRLRLLAGARAAADRLRPLARHLPERSVARAKRLLEPRSATRPD